MSMRRTTVAAAATVLIGAVGAVLMVLTHGGSPLPALVPASVPANVAPAPAIAVPAAAATNAVGTGVGSQPQPVPAEAVTTPDSVRRVPAATSVPGSAAVAAPAPAVAEQIGGHATPKNSPLPDPSGPASRVP